MPATMFICPDGQRVEIDRCLKSCRMGIRCMFLPTLRSVAKSANRNLKGYSVTELLNGCREVYLKRKHDYAVSPTKQLYALHGSAGHAINEGHTSGNILSEERIYGDIASGQFDMYGQLLDDDSTTLGDLKFTSSYKIMRALGYYKIDVPTGEVYKTGAKKGQPKTKKELRTNGVQHKLDWAIQVNYYRMLLESQGYPVTRMIIQAICRDNSLQISASRGIDQPVYLIPIAPISNQWIERYLQTKKELLDEVLGLDTVPPPCRHRETWGGKKCSAGYCDVSSFCDYAQSLKPETEEQQEVTA